MKIEIPKSGGMRRDRHGIRTFSLGALAMVVAFWGGGVSVAAAAKVIAKPDTVKIAKKGGKATVDVLKNDRGVTRSKAKVKVSGAPKHGKAWFNGNKKLVYAASKNYKGLDTLTYRVTTSTGAKAFGTVTVKVACTQCGGANGSSGGTASGASNALPSKLTLTWQPVSAAVSSYKVYSGSSPTQASVLAKTVPASTRIKGTGKPGAVFDVVGDLGARKGDQVCFRVRSVNGSKKSAFSSPICTTV